MVGPAVALAAALWLALLIATPIGPASFAALMYTIGSFLCHQIPERSFHLAGFQIPVCARCLGIYAGFAVMACAHVSLSRLHAFNDWQRLTPGAARWVFLVGAVPTALTLMLEWSGVWGGSNIVRAIAGLVLGASLALVVMSVVATLHYSGCERRRPIGPSRLPPRI